MKSISNLKLGPQLHFDVCINVQSEVYFQSQSTRRRVHFNLARGVTLSPSLGNKFADTKISHLHFRYPKPS